MSKHTHEWERGAHMAAAFGIDGRTYACAICGAAKPKWCACGDELVTDEDQADGRCGVCRMTDSKVFRVAAHLHDFDAGPCDCDEPPEVERWYAAFEKVSGQEATTYDGKFRIFIDFTAEYARLAPPSKKVAP